MDAGSILRRLMGAFYPIIAGILLCSGLGHQTMAAGVQTEKFLGLRTENFLIDAPTRQMAEAVGKAAEAYRHDLAMHWLGKPLPAWPSLCPITVISGNRPAEGETQYDRFPVRNFRMWVKGTPERILDSVLPHEITHTILATYFGRPLPRWADEGICTMVEHPSEKNKHEVMLRRFLASHRGIAMNKMFLLKEYPPDMLPMYAQGYSVCRFLIEQQDPQTFISFLGDYMRHPSWTENVRKHYGYESLAELQESWLAWVTDGSGSVQRYVKSRPQPDVPAANGAVAQVSGVTDDSPPSTRLASRSAGSRSSVLSSPANQSWYHRNRDAAADPPSLWSANRVDETVLTDVRTKDDRPVRFDPAAIKVWR